MRPSRRYELADDCAVGKVIVVEMQVRKTITVFVKGDRPKEANETFHVNSRGPLATQRSPVGTIVNDDRGRARRARMR